MSLLIVFFQIFNSQFTLSWTHVFVQRQSTCFFILFYQHHKLYESCFCILDLLFHERICVYNYTHQTESWKLFSYEHTHHDSYSCCTQLFIRLSRLCLEHVFVCSDIMISMTYWMRNLRIAKIDCEKDLRRKWEQRTTHRQLARETFR